MRKLFAILLAFVLVLGIAAPVTAADSDVQYQYSTSSNSGKRHELCTTLEGTSAGSYYTGNYTFDILSEQSGSDLLHNLRALMKSTHKKNSSYADCRDMADQTDCENNDGRIVTIYTSYSATYSQYQSGNGWNREHVWPKSLGGFETTGAGADLHHIRPSENRTNSTRSNKKYGNVSGTKTVSGNLSGLVGGNYDNTYYEPLDNVKGDVARICLYVYVRYGGEISKCSSITNVFQSIDVLLEWCALDPVDTWEMGRNEVVAAYQGNRNVFIDYPEYAWLIFDRDVPADLVTPTSSTRESCADGHSYGSWTVVKEATVQESGLRRRSCTRCGETQDEVIPKLTCAHSNTAVRNEKPATCTEPGYTGDTYCNACGKQVSSGTEIPVTDHSYGDWVTVLEPTFTETGLRQRTCAGCGKEEAEMIPQKECTHENVNTWQGKDATCEEEGYTGDVYCDDCDALVTSGSVIPALGHSYSDWITVKDPTEAETGLKQHSCTVCGKTEEETLPKLESKPTQPTQPTQPTEPDESQDPAEQRNLTWIIVLAAVVIVGVAGVVIVKKKR